MSIFPLYAEYSEFIAEVTKLLNEHVPSLPTVDGWYLSVQLKDSNLDHEVLGHWSDEISDDCWAFEVGE